MGARSAIMLCACVALARSASGMTAASDRMSMSTLDDDPKCARGECLPPRVRALDEDDPKLARFFRRPRPTARFELGYRFFLVADPYGGSLPFHTIELDAYPISSIFRLGMSLAGGAAPRESAWLFDVGLSIGVQYPARVTPFLDARLAVGAIGAQIVSKNLVSYIYQPTLEGGIEVYLGGRYHFTAAVGYSHPVYGGVDANAIQQMVNAGQTPKYDVQSFGYDTVTVRVSLGL